MQFPAGNLLDFFGQFGFVGLVLILWYLDSRTFRQILEKYGKDMKEIRNMYENNVDLVRATQEVARDQHKIIVINIEALQKLTDAINTNQYCPAVRLDKQAHGVMTNG